MAEDLFLCFTYYKHDDFHLLIGKVHFVDTYKREFRIVDYHDEIHKLKQDDLIDVKIN
ncbi:YolD-like family protein [Fictibacillus sp. S7]|uniref:YolD-like family protein n=1 Tax=Fictibacillus sp. S7 TaxID=2212476 RepID=UPI0024119800|nr:YolD-like family protein [Fictibacillus sp. S7]